MVNRTDTPVRRRPLRAAPRQDHDPLRYDGFPPRPILRPTPAEPHGRAFPWVAGTVLAVATVVAACAAWLASFANSYCGAAPSATQVRDLRVSYAVIGGLWLLVPAATALVAGDRGRDVTPWVSIAGLGGLITGLGALSAEPSHWCLF
jgi:hypothetical protein